MWQGFKSINAVIMKYGEHGRIGLFSLLYTTLRTVSAERQSINIVHKNREGLSWLVTSGSYLMLRELSPRELERLLAQSDLERTCAPQLQKTPERMLPLSSETCPPTSMNIITLHQNGCLTVPGLPFSPRQPAKDLSRGSVQLLLRVEEPHRPKDNREILWG